MLQNASTYFFEMLIRNKGPARTWLNLKVKEHVCLDGVSLDLGNGGRASYESFFSAADDSKRLIKVDLYGKPDVIADCENDLPFADCAFHQVLCFNVLEHIFNFANLLKEIYRIIKPGGVLYLYVPFFNKIHADPNDYYRYSSSTISRLLSGLHFTDIRIYTHSGAAITIAKLMSRFLRFRFLKFCVYSVAMIVDRAINIIINDNQVSYPLGYFIISRK